MTNKSFYKISEFAELIGVSEQTLRNWEKEGILIPSRTAGGWRHYTQEQLDQYKKPTQKESSEPQNINIRLKKGSEEFKVQIQHLITKEFVTVKTAKTYKTGNAQLNKHKKYLEEFGANVNVIKYIEE